MVEGRRETPKDAILAALGSSAAIGAAILNFDPAAAQARIAKLPWVGSVTVQRRLPGTILVHLVERVPLARWQHDKKTVVIDAEGQPLTEAQVAQFGELPLVVGEGAPSETQALLDDLKPYPDIAKLVTASVRVAGRRWDLHIDPKIVVQLPEKDIDEALKTLQQLITEKNLLDRDVSTVDLRVPNRVTVEPAGLIENHPKGTRL